MAEYYPLISRAVAGLREGAPEARQAIYGRAKQALIGQLRGMQPPIPDDAVNKEIAALDEAIARIEAELAPAVSAVKKPDVAPASSVAAAAPAPPKPQTMRPAAPAATAKPGSTPRPERAIFEPRTSPPPARPTAAARSARPNAPVAAPPPPAATDVPPPPAEPVAATPPVEPPSSSLPTAPTLDTALLVAEPDAGGRLAPTPDVHSDRTDAVSSSPVPELTPETRVRDEGIRPAIPRQTITRPRNLRVWIVAVAALAAVVVIALTAWKLRDHPEELARIPATTPQASSTPGKIVERADGSAPSDDDTADIPAPVASSTQTPAPSSEATNTQPAGEQSIPVSYKAAILVAAPDTPEKVKTYVGSVVWRSENVTQGQDQPLGTAVRADIEIPDARIKLVVEIRKNVEAQFPASHTIDLKFAVEPGSPIGGVKQIDVPQMRREDAPTGDSLTGVPVTITGNYFLVGLTRGDAEPRNVDALRTRGWFDIPMVLDDGRPAKITFEKGASGDRIMTDALTAWVR